MFHWIKGRSGLIISVAGICIAVFAVLWVTVIFPSFNKVPTDYQRTYYFDAEFEALDMETMDYEIIPLRLERAQEAVKTNGDTMYIHEVITAVRTDTGEDLSAKYGAINNKVIDRSTTLYITELDEIGRWGYFCPPRPLEVGQSFDMWQPGAMQPLPMNFVREENFRGMDVLVFNSVETNVPINRGGFDLFYSIDATSWIEPTTGAVVNQNFYSLVTADEAGEWPVTAMQIDYTEYTINDLMALAEHGSWMIYVMQTFLPWMLFSAAAIMVLLGLLLSTRRQRRMRTWKVGVGPEVSPYPSI